MTGSTRPKLVFPCGFDERDAAESEMKGWLGEVLVELPSGSRIKVCFYDPVRLGQDLEAVQESGEVCIGEPGLIVVPSVTREYMEKSVEDLYRQGYFDSLVPLPDVNRLQR